MSNLILPRREIWTQQPTRAVGIDWASPITAKLVSAVLPSAKLFAGTHPHSSGFVQTNTLVTKYGVALGRETFNWSLPQRPVFGVPATSDMTMLVFMYGDSSVLTESQPVSTGQNAASLSSSISVGDGTTKALRYRIYLGGTRYAGGSSVIPAEPTVVVGRQRYGVEQALFVGGEKDPVTTSFTGGHSGVTHFGCYSGNALTKVLLSALWARALSDAEIRSLSENPWQIFAPRETRLFVTASSGAINGSASGSFSPVSITPQTAGASGSASASGSLASISITPATATASAGGSATASGSFSALSISPATATAAAGATASGALAAISLSAPSATATGTTAGNAVATGTPAQITINPATASAIGSAVASGAFAALSITPPTATATSAGDAHAIAAFAALSINPTTGAAYGSAIATGSLPVISLSPATGTASTGTFTGSISDEDITRIVQAVLAALNATAIPVNIVEMNSAPLIGTGTLGDDWRGVGVPPQ